MSTIDVNQNVAQCLKTSTNWGHEVVYNVCTGTQHIVPWGTVDWTFAIGASIFMGALALLLLGAIVSMFTW